MTLSEKIVGAADLVVETLLFPFLGPTTWRNYPSSREARELLNGFREKVDKLQGN